MFDNLKEIINGDELNQARSNSQSDNIYKMRVQTVRSIISSSLIEIYKLKNRNKLVKDVLLRDELNTRREEYMLSKEVKSNENDINNLKIKIQAQLDSLHHISKMFGKPKVDIVEMIQQHTDQYYPSLKINSKDLLK